MIRVLIVDDHPIVRKGLRLIISEEDDMKVIGEAEDSSRAMALILSVDCEIVILDLSIPGRGGMDILSEILRVKPKLPVLILSVHPEDQYAVQALKAGAAGYMCKETAPEDLILAIREIVNGKKYISGKTAELLASSLRVPEGKKPHELLSVRERQVMMKIASGKQVSQIAVEMSLSVKTISTYRARILEKMNLKNNAELTYYVIKNGLAE